MDAFHLARHRVPSGDCRKHCWRYPEDVAPALEGSGRRERTAGQRTKCPGMVHNHVGISVLRCILVYEGMVIPCKASLTCAGRDQ